MLGEGGVGIRDEHAALCFYFVFTWKERAATIAFINADADVTFDL